MDSIWTEHCILAISRVQCTFVIIWDRLSTNGDQVMNNIDPSITIDTSAAAAGVAVGILLIFIFIGFLIQIIAWVGMWKSASKAGQFGLLACIPIVQFFIWAIMAKKEPWWGLLCLIPVVNIVFIIIIFNEISKQFGRGIGTTLGLIFLPFIFWPILGFGSAQYQE